MKHSLKVLSLAAAISAIANPAIADDNGNQASIADALSNGKTALSFRLRYEDVDVDNASNDSADALTLKSRITFTSAKYQGFGVLLEVDDVTALTDDDYPTSKALKGTGDYPGKAIIADPEGTEVNQAYISYTHGDTTAKYGRQRIILDNQRFVGGVGFRQNEQTYDALSITNTSLQDTKIFYAHVTNVNRIFGENDPVVSDTDSSTDLLNVNYSGLSAGNIIFYAYLLDNENADSQLDTYGIRFAGKAGDFGYAAEYATQEADTTSGSADADYLLLEGSYNIEGVKITAGYEVLGSDDGDYGFSTPLATGHKFQGWTDQFLGTPDQGIQDIYVSVGGKVAGIKLVGVYHDYHSVEDNAAGHDYLGEEFGFVAAKKLGNYGLSLKYSTYSKGNSSFGKVDTDKLWLTATANF